MRGGSSDSQRVITKVDPNGTVTRYRLNSNGTTGSLLNIKAANIVKGRSKAANFINNVGITIQANKREPLLINGLPESLILYPE